MATTIRLKRRGAKKAASFRIIVTDSREGTAGASIERLGLYNPRTQPSLVRINAQRTLHWLNEGAQPSDTVRSLLRKTGVWQQFHDGVDPASLETAIIEIGPPPGQRGTSQRPKPSAEAPPEPEPEPEPEAAPEPEPEPPAAEEAAPVEAKAEAAAPADESAAEATEDATEAGDAGDAADDAGDAADDAGDADD
ncbi:30S ribosomal protein S16 [Candidatus Palauibacter sp.]|uniref:30S ribosomal protein S16 n=1 Tax=Candidatus Palauibacter sp. TaxID=3101350 RepID=UPI003B5251D0